MRRLAGLLLTSLALLPVSAASDGALRAVSAQSNIILTSVEGRVVGPDGKGLERAIVRLFDEGGTREAGRVYTDGSGRFRFTVPAGTYIVEADPISTTGIAKARQEVLVNPAPNSRGGERTFVNFFLKLAVADRAERRGPLFAQDVPTEALKEYERGVELLASDKEAGYEALRKALRIYGDYYYALETLGTAYVKDDRLDHALVLLLHAVQVNPKGERSHYALGVVYYKKDRFDLAARAFLRAGALLPDDPNTLMYLGLSQWRNKQNAEAEATLKRAHERGAKGVPELHLALAKIYVESNRHKEAAAELRALLRESPDLKDKEKIRALAEKYERKS